MPGRRAAGRSPALQATRGMFDAGAKGSRAEPGSTGDARDFWRRHEGQPGRARLYRRRAGCSMPGRRAAGQSPALRATRGMFDAGTKGSRAEPGSTGDARDFWRRHEGQPGGARRYGRRAGFLAPARRAAGQSPALRGCRGCRCLPGQKKGGARGPALSIPPEKRVSPCARNTSTVPAMSARPPLRFPRPAPARAAAATGPPAAPRAPCRPTG